MREIYIQYYTSPCGELILASIGNELCLCDWNGMSCAERNKRRISKYLNVEFRTGSSSVIEKTKTQLDDYFAGKRKVFNIPLCPFGTDFQLQVWKSLLDIPYGETRSYMDIARNIGNPKGGKSRGTSHWRQRHRHTYPLPSSHWQQPFTDRLCGRIG